MARLSVNINKVATLRNARGGNLPNVVKFAQDCEKFGAQGITVHPRPDERHIRYSDVFDLKAVIQTEFNIEGNPTKQFIELIEQIKPTQVTLVPDAPEVLTSNMGWKVSENFDFLQDIIARFKSMGIRTSIFVDTDLHNLEMAKKTGTDRIELYTEPYAMDFKRSPDAAISSFILASEVAHGLGLEVNAGHDLNLDNLPFFAANIPYLDEVSIGHALISESLYLGLEETISKYLIALKK
ncbi:pyridoxine 5'-phosphate synthase [Porphyromonas pogonae]|uniref:pyridoxine 5'-phosphate synthase n=1 Tax=Porphyromonas pogonae TaxID=867595 RepID=UPI002E7A8398|nr:pyridoxine 5'-phosphate synthase [Porphyromonas pogonae]